MLTQTQVMSFLLQHQLIDSASIVTGEITIVDISRRNCNFQVINTQGPCYLIKQGGSPDRAITVAHEANIYHRLQDDSSTRSKKLMHYLPRFYRYDSQEQILILELLRDAEDCRQYHTRRRRFSTALAAQMGKALATLHNLPAQHEQSQSDAWFSGRPPWILSIHRPSLRIFWDASEAKLQLIRIIQRSSEFSQLLDDLRQDWLADRLIHFDIKWDNWIIPGSAGTQRKTRLKLVDWELAGLGDPCWDLGSVFNDYLSFWLSSIPMTGDEPPERFLELACSPLERMQPALRAFWAAYIQQMRFDASTACQWQLKAVRYAAARLVQTAFEQMQRSNQLTSNVVCLLQLSLNILQRPHEAAVLLLGLPLHTGGCCE